MTISEHPNPYPSPSPSGDNEATSDGLLDPSTSALARQWIESDARLDALRREHRIGSLTWSALLTAVESTIGASAVVLGTSLARVVRRVPAGGASLAALSSLLLVAPAVSVAVVVPVDAIAAHYQRHPHKIPMMPPLYGAAAAASVYLALTTFTKHIARGVCLLAASSAGSISKNSAAMRSSEPTRCRT